MSKTKVIQVGCGKMSKYTMRYVYESDGQIVAGIDINPDIIGKDIGFVMESKDKGVIIEPLKNLDNILKTTKPDIAIVTTMSLLNDVSDVLEIIVRNGVNAITTCEEAFFAENSNPTIFKKLDNIAKENNCTISGCGYQDVFWGNLIAVLAGTTHNITKISGSSSYNVEDYGIALAKAHGAGLTLREFDKEIASIDNISYADREKLINRGEFLPSYMWNATGWIADRLGLHITKMEQKCLPTTSDEDLHSDTLEMDIKCGDATGMSAIVTALTKEGITIEAQCIGKVYASDEYDANVWTIHGEPDTTVTINKPQTVELTCANVVNRIPDVINAPSGFISTSKMNISKYRI